MSNFGYTRPDSFPPVVKNLVIINAIVFILQQVFDRQMELNTGESLTMHLALWPIGSNFFEPYQLATHMFTHGGFQHILFNMLSLYIFGRMLENIWGPKRFLTFYLLSGLGAAALHLLVTFITNGYAPVVGASGAIMGLVAAFAYLFPNTEMYMFFIPFPIKAKWLAIGYVVLDLFGGLSNAASGVAHFAHLGGAITGFIIVLIWNKTNRRRFY